MIIGRDHSVRSLFVTALALSTLMSFDLASAQSIWNHNGSVMTLEANGSDRRFRYQSPRSGLTAQVGDIVFEGQRRGKQYIGTAYLFSRNCGIISYPVSGEVSSDDLKVTMVGQAPRRNSQCQITSYQNDILIFSYIAAGSANVLPNHSAGPQKSVPSQNSELAGCGSTISSNSYAGAILQLQGSACQEGAEREAREAIQGAQSQAANRFPQPVIYNNQQSLAQVNSTQINNNIIIKLKGEAADIKGEIELLGQIVLEQKKIFGSGGDIAPVYSDTIDVLEERVAVLKADLTKKSTSISSSTLTPVKPDDADLGITARRASEVYPKVPYYIPGTRETGEFWVEPVVSDNGALVFRFKFVDIKSTSAEKVRGSIEMKPEEVEAVQKALLKIALNSKLAHEKKIRRYVATRITCFPLVDCPPEGKKLDAKASTEIIFTINEDGSTNGRIQRNKGRFDEGYNFSIKSGLLLQAYLSHVLKEGKGEYEAGSTSDDELRSMFR